MHQRRLAAANAAQMQQERMNAQQQQKLGNQQQIMDELYGQVQKPLRPKASVGPFQVSFFI
jgi:hypothetical protein